MNYNFFNKRSFMVLSAAAALALASVAGALIASAQQPDTAPLGTDTFTDIGPTMWANEAIGWAVSEGITTGTSATTFSPLDTLNRAQMVTFLYRYHQNVVEPELIALQTQQRGHEQGHEQLEGATESSSPEHVVTFTGTGKGTTEFVTLAAGRHRVVFEVDNNHADFSPSLSLKAFGRHEGRDSLVFEFGDEAAGSSSWVETLDIGGFGVPEGEVYFEVEVEPGATWTLTVTRL